MSASDTEQEHPSKCFSQPSAKGLEGFFTTAHNNLLTKIKVQTGHGCPTKLWIPPFNLLFGKTDTEWQRGCWCLPPNACELLHGEQQHESWEGTYENCESRTTMGSVKLPGPGRSLINGCSAVCQGHFRGNSVGDFQQSCRQAPVSAKFCSYSSHRLPVESRISTDCSCSPPVSFIVTIVCFYSINLITSATSQPFPHLSHLCLHFWGVILSEWGSMWCWFPHFVEFSLKMIRED